MIRPARTNDEARRPASSTRPTFSTRRVAPYPTKKKASETAAEDRMPTFVVRMNPLELLQIAAPSNADAGFDLSNRVGQLTVAVLIVGCEGRLDECAPLDRTAVLTADQVIGKQSGTGHCRSQRGDGDALEQRRLSRSVPSKHQVHVREGRIAEFAGRRSIRMEESDSRSLERPEIARGDRIDIHRGRSTVGVVAGRYYAATKTPDRRTLSIPRCSSRSLHRFESRTGSAERPLTEEGVAVPYIRVYRDSRRERRNEKHWCMHYAICCRATKTGGSIASS